MWTNPPLKRGGEPWKQFVSDQGALNRRLDARFGPAGELVSSFNGKRCVQRLTEINRRKNRTEWGEPPITVQQHDGASLPVGSSTSWLSLAAQHHYYHAAASFRVVIYRFTPGPRLLLPLLPLNPRVCLAVLRLNKKSEIHTGKSSGYTGTQLAYP